MIKKFRLLIVAVLSISLVGSSILGATAYAAPATCDEGFYSDNNIVYYNPCADICDAGAATSVTVGKDSSLPAATTKYLDAADVRTKVEANKERYLYAQSKVGLPWQVVAALHYREGGLRSNATILNGVDLGTGVNVDGQNVVADPKEDAVNAANMFVQMAKSVYSVDVLAKGGSGLTTEQWGNAFLAYNRGSLYKQAGKTYDQSPYVMNGLDAKHMNMSWVGKPADPAVSGVDGNKAGALSLLVYLGGMSLQSSCSSSGAVIGDAVKTAINYAIPTPAKEGDTDPALATQVYRDAMPQFNGTNATYPQITDCGRFVSTVLHASKADENFPQVSVGVMRSYMDSSSKYTALGTIAYSELRPGDIISNPDHIMMYTGQNSNANGNYYAADASYQSRIPSVRTSSSPQSMLNDGASVWRLK